MEDNFLQPDNIIKLIEIFVSWPIASIAIVLLLKDNIGSVLKDFFEKNKLKKLSAGGVHAEFSQNENHLKGEENKKEFIVSDNSAEEDVNLIRKAQIKRETEFSKKLLQNLKDHRSSINLNDKDALELNEREVSLLRAEIAFYNLTKILYKSQVDLFQIMLVSEEKTSEKSISDYFNTIRSNNADIYRNINVYQYLSYPMSVGLIQKENEKYILTSYGKSYLHFLSKNPHLLADMIAG